MASAHVMAPVARLWNANTAPLAVTSSPAITEWEASSSGRLAAKTTLRLPAPAMRIPSGMACALDCRMARSCSGVRKERDSSRSAIDPEPTAAAMLVPESCSRLPSTMSITSSGCSRASVEPGASSPRILLPGATRSGLISPSNRVGPRELYVHTTSSDRCAVAFVFRQPTVIANGELPGTLIPPNTSLPSASLPRLPADATTTIPAR